jgi:leucyl-tRNA synthetase
MTILIPFTPHLARECLEKLKAKDITIWPNIDKKLIEQEKIKIAIQINGKTRDILELDKDLDEKKVINLCKKNDKIGEKLSGQNIKKIIFVKNRIINFIIK